MKKNFLIVGLLAFTFSSAFIACEKENIKQEEETEIISVETSDVRTKELTEALEANMEKFPTKADRDIELRRLKLKYEGMDSREDCIEHAWAWGTVIARGYAEFTDYDLDYLEWFFTDVYYRNNCL